MRQDFHTVFPGINDFNKFAELSPENSGKTEEN
jgi:hypothetical protein